MQTNEELIGAIDIGGTKIAIGLVSRNGHVVCRRTLRTSQFPECGPAHLAMSSALKDCLREADARLAGIGVSCTGPVDPQTGIIGKVANLPRGWEGYPLVDEMKAAFDTRTVMENDADAAALAEFKWGCGRGAGRFLYVTISTGIGAGLIVKNELYRGAGGSHPEMGHHGIDPSGPDCYCGARGCWESLASGIALRDWFLLNDHEQRFSSHSLTAERIFALHATADLLAERAVARLAHYIGLGLSNLTTILVPDVIALGGGIALQADTFLPTAVEMVRGACGEVPGDRVAIQIASLHHDLDVAGAAAAWLHTCEPTRFDSPHDLHRMPSSGTPKV